MSTPNIVSNSITRTIFSTILITVIGCTPGAIVDDLDDASTDAATEDGDGDATGETDAPADLPETGEPTFSKCTADGRCWIKCTSWSAWAQTITDEGMEAVKSISEPVDDSVFGMECYRFGEGAHLCMLDLNCGAVVGRPVAEVPLVPGDGCKYSGPWEYTGAAQHCFGVLDGIAIALIE